MRAKLWIPNNISGALTGNRRFLRARRFVPQEAFKQFKDTEDWRKENKLSEIFNTIEIEEYEQTRRLVEPQTLHAVNPSNSIT